MPRIFVVSVLFATAVLAAAAQSAPPSRSTRDGVYTSAQADRGQTLFDTTCADCHTPNMWPRVSDGKSLAELYGFISQNMPEPAPGTLLAQDVRDAIAYLLKSNDLPAGSAELPAGLDAMKQIRMERR